MREAIVERNSIVDEAAYFGVMTTSPEETIEEARGSLGQTGTKQDEFTAIDGHSRPGHTRSAVVHFHPSSPGSRHEQITEQARAHFRTSHPAWHERQWPSNGRGSAPLTFLYALSRALLNSEPSSECCYVYNERSYHLRIDKERDHHQGVRLAQLGLTARPDAVLQVRGRIREAQGTRQTSFRLWIEDGPARPLPLRIEFQPRSYLRLSFEADPKAINPPLEEVL
jgi:hypothetical protein